MVSLGSVAVLHQKLSCQQLVAIINEAKACGDLFVQFMTPFTCGEVKELKRRFCRKNPKYWLLHVRPEVMCLGASDAS